MLTAVDRAGVEITLRGERHRLTWGLVHAAADQHAPDRETMSIRGRYRAVRAAALLVRDAATP